MDASKLVEAALVETLKPRGYRKRARNWFRTTTSGQFQVINLQKSSWGGGDCYLNVGWDPEVAPGAFIPEYKCMVRFRAERTDVIPSTKLARPDGSVIEVDAIRLLDRQCFEGLDEDDYSERVLDLIARPVADLLDQTPSVTDLVPLLTRHPGWIMKRARDRWVTNFRETDDRISADPVNA